MHHVHNYRFCPVCGGGLETRQLIAHEPERLVCSECDFIFYRDPKLVACSIIELSGKFILLQRRHNPHKGKWVVPGGYVDQGEEVEAAAVRETREECGLMTRIKNTLGVYSYKGYVDVMVFYIAEHISGDLTQGDEVLDIKLYPPEEIPWEKLAFKSTKDALRDYCALRKGE